MKDVILEFQRFIYHNWYLKGDYRNVPWSNTEWTLLIYTNVNKEIGKFIFAKIYLEAIV